MDFHIFGQLLFDGLCSGLVFVILACGLVIIVSTSRILFMTYGVFYTMGAYLTYYGISWFNLPYFASLVFGTVVSARVIMDRDTGRSKGFGFVEMPDDGQAQAAINGLNEKDLNGRAVRVNEAKPREDRPRRPRY